jgi:hypothetical protein
VASRLIERIIREDRMELKKRLKENGDWYIWTNHYLQ